jgi:2-polyprenyl-3-methyl-5-hydroxy-6-metoxy-1,4-benzoquinol methylase
MENKISIKFEPHAIIWDDEKVSRLWDYYARTPPFSDVYFSKVFGHHMLRHSGLPLTVPLEVLDFGCGPGFIWEHLQNLSAKWQYTALDFSPDSVSKLAEKGAGKQNFKGVQHVSALPSKLNAAMFDVVLLFEVVEHLKDEYLDGTLAEISRLLKPGGVVVISTPNEEDLSKSTKFCPDCGSIFHEWQHIRNWSVARLEQRLQSHNFKLRTSKTLDFDTQTWNIRGIFKKTMRIARKLFNNNQGKPHMITVFQKK